MIEKFYKIVLFVCCAQIALAQEKPSLQYYLPNIAYDPAVPTPASFLGYEVGEWHVSHDQLAGYMREIARSSKRVTLREYGRSHENRPLLCLTITAPENQARIEDIRQQHQSLANPTASDAIDMAALPVVAYTGYSIHGNEASGSNAALMVAYYLAAGQSAEVNDLLKNAVILLDPCFNPDGLQRFSGWINSRRSQNLMPDPLNDEFNEPWPKGRTNHYWFDLNRDWLVAQQPETAGRVAIFHDWQPNVLTDHHEMGSNATFFFQPGVPSRVNPITPKRNQELTAKISLYHAKLLSEKKVLFFTQESFDDFYYGKGSTYPDANGGIGILFEQASSRGSAQETDNGLLTFPFTIRNQVFASLSTLNALRDMRQELNEYTRDFYKKSLEDAQKDDIKAYLIKKNSDPAALQQFLKLLKLHQIKVYEMAQNTTINGQNFEATDYVIPMQQPHYRLIKGIFDRQTTFSDSVFYDISAWTLPLAFNLQYAEARREFSPKWLGQLWDESLRPLRSTVRSDSAAAAEPYAIAIPWDQARAPQLLAKLLRKNIRVKVAKLPFSVSPYRFEAGTLLLSMDNQPFVGKKLVEHILEIEPTGLELTLISNGLTMDGPDLGSSNFPLLKLPKILLVTGEGANPADVGEAWHALDTRYGLPPSMVQTDRFNSLNLSKFNIVLLMDVNNSSISAEKIRDFVQTGGTVIASGASLKWLRNNNVVSLEFRSPKFGSGAKQPRRPFSALENDLGARALPGAIFEAVLDLSSPLCFGYAKDRLPIFLSDTIFLETAMNPYATPVVFTENPLMAGYVHPKEKPLIGGSAAVVVSGVGRGRVVCLAGDPLFRGFWRGTERLFINAVFFGHLISGEAVEKKK